MLKFIFLTNFFMIIVPFCSWGNTISMQGTVVNLDGDYLPGVNIFIEGSDIEESTGTVTDENGFYSFDEIPIGEFTIRISHIGYKTLVEEIRTQNDPNFVKNFTLEFSAFIMTQHVVTASKNQEKLLYSPASTFLLIDDELHQKPSLTIADQVQDIPGVDYAQTGLVQNSVAARGFNNTFPTSLLTLTDNRIASLPSLRVNWSSFIPTTNDDIERIEIVLGPGSALYGPNSANGVMHIITQSPFESAGTRVSMGMGERSLRKIGLRHASVVNEKLAFKISTQYYTATDWKYNDPLEPNKRDYGIEKQSIEFRLDYRPKDDIKAILGIGHSQSDQIQITGLGAVQQKNWNYNFIQGRFIYRDWFAQLYHNTTNSGDSWLLQSGNPTIDKSSQTVFQIQHSSEWSLKNQFVYGFDLLLTQPDTEGSIHGLNENNDEINELGIYAQTEHKINKNFNLVGALRVDKHSKLNEPITSLRGAAIFMPNKTNTIRLTYNNSFAAPYTTNLFLDLVANPDPFRVGANFSQALGYSTSIPFRAQGTFIPNSEKGFTFRRNENGTPFFRSPFAQYANYENASFIELDDPKFNNAIWGIVRNSVMANLLPQAETLFLQELVEAGLSDKDAQEQAVLLTEILPTIIPTEVTGLANELRKFDPETQTFKKVDDVRNIPRTKETLTRTLELGYKGVIRNKFILTADLYRTKTKGFIGPLRIESPNVFFDKNSLDTFLELAIDQAINDLDSAVIDDLQLLDQAEAAGFIEGNNNGTIADELAPIFTSTAAQIPWGTVTPEQAYDPNAVLLTVRNFGDITHYGLDFNLAYYPMDHLAINGNYSYISKNIYRNVENLSDIALNAPKNKFKVAFTQRLPDSGLQFGFSMRYTDSFPMVSGIYIGSVKSYTTVNANLSYDIPVQYDVTLRLNATNILDKKYRAFVGAPLIGRMLLAELGFSF